MPETIAAWLTTAGAAIGGTTGAAMIMYSQGIAYTLVVAGSDAIGSAQARRRPLPESTKEQTG